MYSEKGEGDKKSSNSQLEKKGLRKKEKQQNKCVTTEKPNHRWYFVVDCICERLFMNESNNFGWVEFGLNIKLLTGRSRPPLSLFYIYSFLISLIIIIITNVCVLFFVCAFCRFAHKFVSFFSMPMRKNWLVYRGKTRFVG